MAKVTIIGASRGCGLAATNEALARGWSVSGLARKPDLAAPKNPNLVWYAGDARNQFLLEQATKDTNAVIIALSARTGLARVKLFSQTVAAVLPIMAKAGAKRLVFVSGLGAGDSKGHGGFLYDWVFYPLLLGRNYADKNRAEALIKKSATDWTILRPVVLTNRARTGKVIAITNPAQYRNGTISRADVGWYICECLARDMHIRETPLLTT
jgi:putative NADH-flavin reductase